MTEPLLADTQEPEQPASHPRNMLPLALFIFVVFYLAEPHSWRFSTSEYMHLSSSEESIAQRIQHNIGRHQMGSGKRRVAVAVLGAYGAFCLLRSGERRFRIRSAVGWTVAAFLAWAIASVLWSIDPLITVRRLFVLLLLSLGAAGIARRYTWEELAQLTWLITGMMMVGGFACELALGTFRPWAAEYRFSGLTWPAFTCWNLSLFVIALLTFSQSRRRWLRLSFAACATVLALLTKTRAGAAALVFALVAQISSTWSSTAKALVAFMTCFLVSSALLVASFADQDPARLLLRSINLGREESAHGFSGRAGVWEMLLPYIADRPFRGYGYESFWTPDHLRQIGERNWGAPDAHNGYINLTLGVGLVGSGLYVAALCLAMVRSRRDFLETGSIHDLFPGCVALITAVNALCVANQLNPHIMSFVCLIALARLGFVQEQRIAESPRPRVISPGLCYGIGRLASTPVIPREQK